MSRWVVDIQKRLGAEYWTNVYNVLAGSLDEATGKAGQIANIEKTMTSASVQFDLMRVRPAVLPAGGGTVLVAGGTGARPAASASGWLLPLFCVVRVDLRTATGRPSRKYLRGGLYHTTVVADQLIEPSNRQAFIDNYLTPLLAVPGICDVDSQPFVGGIVFPTIAMRQLRRGSRRKPVIQAP